MRRSRSAWFSFSYGHMFFGHGAYHLSRTAFSVVGAIILLPITDHEEQGQAAWNRNPVACPARHPRASRNRDAIETAGIICRSQICELNGADCVETYAQPGPVDQVGRTFEEVNKPVSPGG